LQLPRWLALAALYQHWKRFWGSKAQSFAASYLDQEKGQAEALTVWQKQLDHRFATFKGLLAS